MIDGGTQTEPDKRVVKNMQEDIEKIWKEQLSKMQTQEITLNINRIENPKGYEKKLVEDITKKWDLSAEDELNNLWFKVTTYKDSKNQDLEMYNKIITNSSLKKNLEMKELSNKRIKEIKQNFIDSAYCKSRKFLCSIDTNRQMRKADAKNQNDFYKEYKVYITFKTRLTRLKKSGILNEFYAKPLAFRVATYLFLAGLIGTTVFGVYVANVTSQGCNNDLDCEKNDGGIYSCEKKHEDGQGECKRICDKDEHCQAPEKCNKNKNQCMTACEENGCPDSQICIIDSNNESFTESSPSNTESKKQGFCYTTCSVDGSDGKTKDANKCNISGERSATCQLIYVPGENKKTYVCNPKHINMKEKPCHASDVIFKTNLLTGTKWTCRTQNTVLIISIILIFLVVLFFVLKIVF